MFIDRLVTRKHAALQKVWRFFIDQKLKITVKKIFRYPFFKTLGQIASANYLDYAPQFLPGDKPKRYAADRSKKPVATDCKSE